MADYSNFFPDLSSDSESENGLKIVIESPTTKKCPRKSDDTALKEKKIMDTLEKDLENALEEKAAKANLTSSNVKHILKEVVTNEHVVALLRHIENPEASSESLPFLEPKITRAKAK